MLQNLCSFHSLTNPSRCLAVQSTVLSMRKPSFPCICPALSTQEVLFAGVPLEGDGLPDGAAEAVINTTAVDVLRRLPGVTEANFRPLMNAASSLAGLADLPLQQLERIMGGAAAAKKLREWLDAVCPVMS